MHNSIRTQQFIYKCISFFITRNLKCIKYKRDESMIRDQNSVDLKLVVESEICSPRATFKLLIPRLNSFAIAHPTAKFETGSQFKMDQSCSDG